MQWNNNYPFLVWLSTLLLGPIVYFTLFPIDKTVSFPSIFQIVFYFFFFGILISAPTFFVLIPIPIFVTRQLTCDSNQGAVMPYGYSQPCTHIVCFWRKRFSKGILIQVYFGLRNLYRVKFICV